MTVVMLLVPDEVTRELILGDPDYGQHIVLGVFGFLSLKLLDGLI